MNWTASGVVQNGVVVPTLPLPEGARVEIRVTEVAPGVRPPCPTPAEMRSMSRERRQAILSAAAAIAEDDYRNDKELLGFDAFSEEMLDDDEPKSA